MFGWELPPYNSGGLGTACLGLTQGLSSRGVEIDFIVPKVFKSFPYSHMRIHSAADYASLAEIQKLLGIEHYEQERITRSLGYGNSLSITADQKIVIKNGAASSTTLHPQTQAAWYAYQARCIAQKKDFDVIHCHDWMTYQCGVAAKNQSLKQGKDRPFVAHVHSTEIDRCGGNGDQAIIKIEKNGLRGADHVVAVSHYTKKVVHQNYGIPLDKISVVHNGIPSQSIPQTYDFHALKKHFKIVLFIGRITFQKGPDYFIKLAKSVTDRDPSVKFVMVGSGDMEKKCIEAAARSGLTGKILFSSFLRGADVNRAYQLADLFVMPSVSEPFGIVALEAMQNGTPALVSKQSGVIEVSENMIAVDFWDIEKMSQMVLKVVQNPDYAQQLKNRGLEDLQHLSWENSAQKMQEVYEQIVENFVPKQLIPQPILLTP